MDPQLDSDLLRTFVAIADTGSFTRAADAVHRTQSAVSMQVKRLEDTVGRSLFARQARGVVLTPSGETLLANARRVLRLLDETMSTLSGSAVEGEVRIGIPEEYGSTLLPRILAQFAASHRRVQVTVHCEGSEAHERALAAKSLDLAVLSETRNASPGEVLIYDPIVWVTSNRHLVHEEDPLPVAVFEQGCWWRDQALRGLEDRGRAYRVAYSSPSVAGVQAAVTSGLAVAVLGRSTVPPGIRILGADDGFAHMPDSAIVLRKRAGPTNEAIERMAAAVADAFRSGGSTG